MCGVFLGGVATKSQAVCAEVSVSVAVPLLATCSLIPGPHCPPTHRQRHEPEEAARGEARQAAWCREISSYDISLFSEWYLSSLPL